MVNQKRFFLSGEGRKREFLLAAQHAVGLQAAFRHHQPNFKKFEKGVDLKKMIKTKMLDTQF